MAIFTAEYNNGDIVFLRTDPEQNERMVVSVRFCAGSILYYLVFGAEEGTWHYGIEISADKDLFKQLNINDKNKHS